MRGHFSPHRMIHADIGVAGAGQGDLSRGDPSNKIHTNILLPTRLLRTYKTLTQRVPLSLAD